jgi:Vault protein inter-alpha-trypsin domain
MRFGAVLQLLGVIAFVSSIGAAEKPPLPTLTVQTDDARHALDLVAVRIDTTIRGHIARTEYELTYRNDLDREVEGDFSYPLPAGAELTGLGLYFNGRLRQAVAVERERARVAYESIVHRRVDPALAEWSSGNRATLRVYPIPAKGEKKVWLSYDQEIVSGDYVLDVRWGKRLRSAEVRIDADGRFVRDSLDVSYERPYRLQLTHASLDRVITAEADARTETLAVRDETTQRWYLAAAPRTTSTALPASPARELVVFWDTSGSAMHQDREALLAFIDLLAARQLPDARVSFIPFDVTTGEASENIDALHAIGGTNYAALFARVREVMAEAPPDTRFLVVTDGITSLGSRREIVRAAGELRALNRPVTVINSSPHADDILLTHIAAATSGWLLDLSQLTPQAAAESAMRVPPRTSLSSNAVALVAPDRLAQHGERMALAAETAFKPFLLPLRVGDETRSLPIRELRHPREVAMVRSAYARAKLRQLLVSGATDEQLLEHGRRFQQLTPRTSLLVLDSWRDYERFDIPMPEDVQREKTAELRQEEKERLEWLRAATREETRPPVIRPPAASPSTDVAGGPWSIEALVTEGDFPLPGVTVRLTADDRMHSEVSDAQGRVRFRLERSPSRFTMRAELPGFSTLNTHVRNRLASGSTVVMGLRVASITEAITVTAEAPAVNVTTSMAASTFIARTRSAEDDALVEGLFADFASPELLSRRRQTLDAVGAKMATIVSVEERVRLYLAARSTFGGDKAFHLHAATLFRNDAPQLAVRILSELAEAYPDDSALLRILARILDGWNERETARLLLQHALEVAASERQTWRELVLLEARLGNDAAIEQIAAAAVATDALIREEIVKEVTPLLDRWRALPRNASHDLRLHDGAALQVDVMWDTNYSDVDLYVTEPGGEKVMYQHRKSAQDGLLHADITTGYGPEIYTVPRPAAGAYEIAVDYYATDDTEVAFETLVHAVVHQRTRSGVDRREYILLLTKGKEHRIVATVEVGK